MFDHVLVGIGDSWGGADALALARRLTSRGGELTLVSVQVVARKPSADSAHVREAQERERRIEALASLGEEAGVDAKIASVEALSVASGLHTFAGAKDADLLVVGASRTSDVDRLLVGDPIRDVLRGAPCPVAVAPVGYESRGRAMKDIAVAYDGSPDSDRALAVARKLAAASRADLAAVEAIPTSVETRDPWNPDDAMAKAVADAEQRIVALGGVRPEVREGDAAEELARFEPSVDLLVVAGHERGPIERFLSSSTEETLAERPATPLLVLPPN
jgi:nucleotide-binding universal stress UspA family protein